MGYTKVVSGQTFDSTRSNPYQKFNWIVSIDDFAKAGFKTCSGLEKTVNILKYRDGGDNNYERKEPGFTTYADITLARGMSQDKDMISWANESMNLDGVAKTATQLKRDLTIQLRDPRHIGVRQWNVYEAFIASYKFDDLDASSDDFIIETMVIAHEGWEEVDVT